MVWRGKEGKGGGPKGEEERSVREEEAIHNPSNSISEERLWLFDPEALPRKVRPCQDP